MSALPVFCPWGYFLFKEKPAGRKRTFPNRNAQRGSFSSSVHAISSPGQEAVSDEIAILIDLPSRSAADSGILILVRASNGFLPASRNCRSTTPSSRRLVELRAVGVPTTLSKFSDYQRLSVAVPKAFFPTSFQKEVGKRIPRLNRHCRKVEREPSRIETLLVLRLPNNSQQGLVAD